MKDEVTFFSRKEKKNSVVREQAVSWVHVHWEH